MTRVCDTCHSTILRRTNPGTTCGPCRVRILDEEARQAVDHLPPAPTADTRQAILDALHQGPATTADLARLTGRSTTTTNTWLTSLRAEGLVHRATTRSGGGVHALTGTPLPTATTTRDVILTHLAAAPATTRELIEATGSSRQTVHRAVTRLHLEGVIHPAGHAPRLNGGRAATIYQLTTQAREAA